MEICVGEYVRTKDGYIAKIIKIDDTFIWCDCDIQYDSSLIQLENRESGCTYKDIIVKHSPNIIDLIEEDDIGIMRYNGLIFKKFITKDDILELKFKNYELLEIVTKELFNQVKYEV